ncbi:response regulator [Paraburkholderia graminis]
MILLVDDDKLTAAAWTTVLRMNGFEVVWAPDGASAWALARMGRPDLLLTDWDMPGIDGPELCRIFRNDPGLASVPIILRRSACRLPVSLIYTICSCKDRSMPSPCSLLCPLSR